MIGTFSSIIVFKSMDKAPAKVKIQHNIEKNLSLNSNSSMICSAPSAIPGNKIPTKSTRAEVIKAISINPIVDGNFRYAVFIRVKAAEMTNNKVIKSIMLIKDYSKDISCY